MSSSQRVPMPVYHHVYPDDDPSLTALPDHRATGVIAVSEFRRHLDFLADGGWAVVSTTQVVDWLDGIASLPDRAVALHFDNGWLDAVTTVMPVLQEYGMSATAYVISGGTSAASEGRLARVQTSTEGAVQKPFITWDHAEELLGAGWEIGAHTATHPKLGELLAQHGEEAVLAEVEASNRAYAEHLGFVPAHFAYPSGSRNAGTDALMARHYRSLRRWSFSNPPEWRFTNRHTPPTALECQNVDSTVAFDDFARIFRDALEE